MDTCACQAFCMLQDEVEELKAAMAGQEAAHAAERQQLKDEVADVQRQMHTFAIPS